MAVLGINEIQRRLDRPPDDVSGLVITPFDRSLTDADSVDLRLGSRFLIPQTITTTVIQFHSRTSAGKNQRLVHIPEGEEIVIPAHSTVLGSVLEYIKLPYDVSGEVLTKSSLARIFITIEGAPWIHPLYRGCLTLEIANASGTPITLKPHTPIGQLVLFQVSGAKRPKRDKIDHYAGPLDPELPK